MDLYEWAKQWSWGSVWGVAPGFRARVIERDSPDTGRRWHQGLLSEGESVVATVISEWLPGRSSAREWCVRESFTLRDKSMNMNITNNAGLGVPNQPGLNFALSKAIENAKAAQAAHQQHTTLTIQKMHDQAAARANAQQRNEAQSQLQSAANWLQAGTELKIESRGGPLRIVDEEGCVEETPSHSEAIYLIRLGRKYDGLLRKYADLMASNMKLEMALGRGASELSELRQTIAEQEIELRRAKRANVKR